MELLDNTAVLCGKYRIERVLGMGSFGAVYEATHLRMQQRVAVKMLAPQHAARKDAVARFEREARAAARLRGPHVVRMIDVDSTEKGIPFLVMELLQGQDLEDLVTSSPAPLSIARAVRFMLDVCDGVREAHAAGIIHRDLKPANVLIVDDGHTAKVVDFGVSRVLDEKPITRDSEVVGTPEYMAPEQLLGGPLDHRVDQYAIGVILYFLLTRRLPFPDHEAHNATPFTVMAATLNKTPTPIEALLPDLPRELAAAVMKAIAREPDQRFESVSAFAAAIQPFAGDESVPVLAATVAMPASAPAIASAASSELASREPEPAPAKKPSPMLAIAAVAIVVVVAGVVIAWTSAASSPATTATMQAPAVSAPAASSVTIAAPPVSAPVVTSAPLASAPTPPATVRATPRITPSAPASPTTRSSTNRPPPAPSASGQALYL